MTSLRMTSHCMTSCCGVLSLLGLCEKDCSINMLNFNKLRFIVNEIFDNSQLFLTDPRIHHFKSDLVYNMDHIMIKFVHVRAVFRLSCKVGIQCKTLVQHNSSKTTHRYYNHSRASRESTVGCSTCLIRKKSQVWHSTNRIDVYASPNWNGTRCPEE